MSTGKTGYVGLNLWEPEDHFLRAEFNADNEKLDEVIGVLFGSQVKIEMGSYVGTGLGGSSNPCSLNFSFVPKLVLIASQITSATSSDSILYMGQPGRGTSSGTASVVFSLSGTTLSWYNAYTGSSGNTDAAMRQLNASGSVYHYLAIG